MPKAVEFNSGLALRELMRRAGYRSDSEFARASGFARQSSIQRYLDPGQWENRHLPLHFVEKASRALVGRGSPPIGPEEVFALANAAPLEAARFAVTPRGIQELSAPSFGVMPRDVPVLGTSACGDDGDFTLNGQIIDYLRRPSPIAANRQVFAIYCQGESMSPWRQSGDPVYVNPARPPRAGDYVLVELQAPEGENGKSFIKRLVALTPTQVVLEQYNPARRDIKFPRDTVKSILRIMDWPELLGI